MNATASAPGKLVLLGEYAVLEGAPALVLATAQRARVRLSPLPTGPSQLHARPLFERELLFEWTPQGCPDWRRNELTTADRGRLAWLGGLLEGLALRGWWPRQPVAAELDTRAFHGADGRKLGLGSSAALTVALAGAGAAAAGAGREPSLEELVALHCALQRGSGSGIDVAASLYGGALRYRLEQGRPRAQPVRLPAGITLLAVASGIPVSTPAALEHLHQWASAHPEAWADLRCRLMTAASDGAAAVDAGAAELEEALAGFARCLEELEAVSGLGEVCGDVHASPRRLAAEAGAVYKPSGAGGDLGIVASTDGARIALLERRATAAAVPHFPLGDQAAGLQVTSAAGEVPLP